MNPQCERKSMLEDKDLKKKILPTYLTRPRQAIKQAVMDTKAKYKKISKKMY